MATLGDFGHSMQSAACCDGTDKRAMRWRLSGILLVAILAVAGCASTQAASTETRARAARNTASCSEPTTAPNALPAPLESRAIKPVAAFMDLARTYADPQPSGVEYVQADTGRALAYIQVIRAKNAGLACSAMATDSNGEIPPSEHTLPPSEGGGNGPIVDLFVGKGTFPAAERDAKNASSYLVAAIVRDDGEVLDSVLTSEYPSLEGFGPVYAMAR